MGFIPPLLLPEAAEGPEKGTPGEGTVEESDEESGEESDEELSAGYVPDENSGEDYLPEEAAEAAEAAETGEETDEDAYEALSSGSWESEAVFTDSDGTDNEHNRDAPDGNPADAGPYSRDTMVWNGAVSIWSSQPRSVVYHA